MKKLIPFFILFVLSTGLFAQAVAVDDTAYFSFGETITFNPILNDYDTVGDEIKIQTVLTGYEYDILSFNDSLITFKIKDFFTSPDASPLAFIVKYQLQSDHPIPVFGNIHLLPKHLQIDTLESNQIKTPVYPMNLQFSDPFYGNFEPNFHYPNNSTNSTMYNSGLWIAGMTDSDVLHLSAERYRQFEIDFWPGPLSVDGNVLADSINAGNWFRTWKISREEVNNHIANYTDPNYTMPEAIENWPAHGNPDFNQDEFIAPFVDVDQDLEYHPENGDYPFIKGDVSVFFVYNDVIDYSPGAGFETNPLGVEVHCMAWALNNQRDSEPYDNAIFYSYKIINRSNTDYYNTYLGISSDFDIGNPTDDFVGCHVENGNFFGYNSDDFDEDYGTQIPSQSVCILGGPFMDEDGQDNPSGQCDESINGSGFGDGEVDNERFGMSHFTYFNNSAGGYSSDPIYAQEYYNYLTGTWKDGSMIVYGGDGSALNGGIEDMLSRFMFPGDSDLCHWGTNGIDPGFVWTEETNENTAGDRRGLASMGPFTFEAGSVEYLDIAYVTAPYTEEKSSKDLLQDYIAEIKDDYLEDPLDFGFQYTAIEELAQEERLLQIYPNPVEGDQIWFELEDAESADYRIYNTAGQLVQSGILPNQKQQKINIASLKSSWYLLEIKSNHTFYRAKLIK